MTPIRDRYGALICSLLFIFVYFSLKSWFFFIEPVTNNSEYSLLLFIFPGMIAAHIIQYSPLSYTLMGALLAMPICCALHALIFKEGRTWGLEMAYVSSAIFMCVLGTLIYLIVRSLHSSIGKSIKG